MGNHQTIARCSGKKKEYKNRNSIRECSWIKFILQVPN